MSKIRALLLLCLPCAYVARDCYIIRSWRALTRGFSATPASTFTRLYAHLRCYRLASTGTQCSQAQPSKIVLLLYATHSDAGEFEHIRNASHTQSYISTLRIQQHPGMLGAYCTQHSSVIVDSAHPATIAYCRARLLRRHTVIIRPMTAHLIYYGFSVLAHHRLRTQHHLRTRIFFPSDLLYSHRNLFHYHLRLCFTVHQTQHSFLSLTPCIPHIPLIYRTLISWTVLVSFIHSFLSTSTSPWTNYVRFICVFWTVSFFLQVLNTLLCLVCTARYLYRFVP